MYEGRQGGGLTPQKLEFARSPAEAEKLPSGSSLLEATQGLQPSALIGAAAKQGAFSADVVKALTKVSGLRLDLSAAVVASQPQAWVESAARQVAFC